MAEAQQSRGARWSLNGMTALVTGGTRGIGFSFSPSQCTFSFLIFHFAFALLFWFWFFHLIKLCFRHAIVSDLAAFGASVHTCSRTQTELNKCIQEWKTQGFQVTGSLCDVSSRSQRERLIEEVASTFNGKFNIFVSTTTTHNIDKAIRC